MFAVGRFLASGAAYIGIPPRILLAVSMTGALATAIGAWASPSGAGGLSSLILLTFFEAAIFPLLFAVTLRGQGKYTKRVSAGLIMVLSGGAIWPSIAYGINRRRPNQRLLNMVVPVLLHFLCLAHPLVFNISRTMRVFVAPMKG